MDIRGSRTLIAGATGELGSALANALQSAGAELALAGRDADRLGALGDEFDAPTARLDVRDPESSRTAAEAALSAYLAALRRERRRDGLAVIDVRPPPMDTRFTERALFGSTPDLPEPLAVSEVVNAVVDALREDRRQVAWDLKAHELVTA